MKFLRFIICIGLILASMDVFSSDKNHRNKSYGDTIGSVIIFLENKEIDRRQTLYNQSMVSIQQKTCFCIALLLTPFSLGSVVTVPMQPQLFDISESPVEKFMKQNRNESRLEKSLHQKAYKKKIINIPNHR